MEKYKKIIKKCIIDIFLFMYHDDLFYQTFYLNGFISTRRIARQAKVQKKKTALLVM